MKQTSTHSPLRTSLTLVCSVILIGLPMTARADQPPAIAVQTLAKSTQSWNGQLLPAYPEGQPEVTVLRIVIPAGQKLPMHEHPFINAGVLLKGELTVHEKNGGTKHLKAGDALIELVNEWHYGESVGAEAAEIIVIYAGIEGEPVTKTTE